MFIGKPMNWMDLNGLFSIAMLVYQRVVGNEGMGWLLLVLVWIMELHSLHPFRTSKFDVVLSGSSIGWSIWDGSKLLRRTLILVCFRTIHFYPLPTQAYPKPTLAAEKPSLSLPPPPAIDLPRWGPPVDRNGVLGLGPWVAARTWTWNSSASNWSCPMGSCWNRFAEPIRWPRLKI